MLYDGETPVTQPVTFKQESFWQPSKWFDWWTKGATETKVGKIAALPITLPYATLKAAKETVEQAPKLAKTLPWVLIILAAGVGGYLIFAGRKGTDLTKFLPVPKVKGK